MNRTVMFNLLSSVRPETHRDLLDDLGWRFLGNGSFKQVYGHDDEDYVVKLHYAEGAQVDEVNNILDAPEAIMPSLVPVDQGDGFQLQDRLALTRCEDLCDCYALTRGCDDLQGRNHTHGENGLVLIYDYGQPHQWPRRNP